MKDILPFVGFVVVVIVLLGLATRARRRQAATVAARAAQIGVGQEVMTTSGLYGTVVARSDDDTVMLSIAPGVEVKWALAALRDVESLPEQYRTTAEAPAPADEDGGSAARS